MTTPAPTRRPVRLKRRWLPWALGAGVLLVWAFVMMIPVSFIRDDVEALTEEREIVINDDRLAVELTVPPGLGIESIGIDDRLESCPMISYRLDGIRSSQAAVQLELLPADCQLGEYAERDILNGYHGIYRTLADVPEPLEVTEIESAIGPATVFSQEYVECTNECNTFTEPVAIIELAEPAAPDYPNLVIRGFGDNLTREQLEKIVHTAQLP